MIICHEKQKKGAMLPLSSEVDKIKGVLFKIKYHLEELDFSGGIWCFIGPWDPNSCQEEFQL
jgi:hypothetical protein